MLQLYFIRHGETEWNIQSRMQGRLDSQLTTAGVYDANLLGDRLSSIQFEAVFSSPSNRALQTANILIGKMDQRQVPFQTDERLMEIDLGSWQGKSTDEIKEMDPHRFDCYYNHPHLFENNEGETFLDVRVRLEAFLKSIEEQFSTGNVLIVTHGIVIKVLQMICRGYPLAQLWESPVVEGASLTVVKAGEGKREILFDGDVSHKGAH